MEQEANDTSPHDVFVLICREEHHKETHFPTGGQLEEQPILQAGKLRQKVLGDGSAHEASMSRHYLL